MAGIGVLWLLCGSGFLLMGWSDGSDDHPGKRGWRWKRPWHFWRLRRPWRLWRLRRRWRQKRRPRLDS